MLELHQQVESCDTIRSCVFGSLSPADNGNSVAPDLQLPKEQSEVAMLALRLDACTLLLA